MCISSPRKNILLNNQCMLLHSGKGWGYTRPPAPHSSCQCILPGTGSSACFQHPDTGQSYGTIWQRPLLQRRQREMKFKKQRPKQKGFRILEYSTIAEGTAVTNTHAVPTSLFGCHLAGDAGDVTVETGPACLALAGVSSATLSASTPVLTRRWLTPVHQVLNGIGGTILNVT